jgi:hypothetical protein
VVENNWGTPPVISHHPLITVLLFSNRHDESHNFVPLVFSSTTFLLVKVFCKGFFAAIFLVQMLLHLFAGE